MMYLKEEELRVLLEKAYEAGWYGVLELKDSAVEGIMSVLSKEQEAQAASQVVSAVRNNTTNTFTTTGSWTVPTGVANMQVEVWGSSGGGAQPDGGAGSGAFSPRFTPTFTIGVGGGGVGSIGAAVQTRQSMGVGSIDSLDAAERHRQAVSEQLTTNPFFGG